MKQLPADAGAAEVQEGGVKRAVAFGAHEPAAVAVQPGEVALDPPADPSQPRARLDAFAGAARGDPTAAEPGAVVAGGGAQLCGELVGPLAWAARAAAGLRERRAGIDQALEPGALVHGGRRAAHGQRRAPPLDDQVVVRPGRAPVGGVRPRRGAPPLAGMREASALARRQSSFPAAARRGRRVRCRRSQTPARCQSRTRFPSVMPPQPNSCGKYSQGRPVLSTKLLPARATRLGTGGRPRVPGGRVGGSSGSATAHRSSLTSSLAIPQAAHVSGHYS